MVWDKHKINVTRIWKGWVGLLAARGQVLMLFPPVLWRGSRDFIAPPPLTMEREMKGKYCSQKLQYECNLTLPLRSHCVHLQES